VAFSLQLATVRFPRQQSNKGNNKRAAHDWDFFA